MPVKLAELDAEWLTQALSVRYPDVVVEALEVVEVIWGTATKVLVRATYAAPTEAPGNLCVKAGFSPELRAIMARGYQTESLFYRDLAPLVPGLPACHFAGVDPDLQQGVVILDDLRAAGASFGDATVPQSVDDVAAGLEFLAGVHRTPTPRPAPHWLLAGAHIRAMIGGLLTPAHWDAHVDTPKAAALDGTLRDRERVARGFRALWAREDAGPRTLIHGDANVTNVLRAADGAVRLVDWQFASLSHWAADVGLFVVGALAVEDRRAHERDLLRLYVQARGMPFTEETAWADYVTRHLHGMTYAFTPEEMQPTAVCAALAERFATAAQDHLTLDALGV